MVYVVNWNTTSFNRIKNNLILYFRVLLLDFANCKFKLILNGLLLLFFKKGNHMQINAKINLKSITQPVKNYFFFAPVFNFFFK